MIDPAQFRSLIIAPALERLGLWSLSAEQLLIGTALTESGLRFLTQGRGGPARGLYQIEPSTAHDLYDNWLVFRPAWTAKLDRLIVPGQKISEQLVSNLTYATAVARLIYYRRPEPLPMAGDIQGLARYWKAHYNTSEGAGREVDFVKKAGRVIAAAARKPSVHLRPSTPMPAGFSAQTPAQWVDFLKRHPDQAAAKPERIYLSATRLEELIRVKREVAAAHPYQTDPGKDTWSVLEGRQPGDCEDIALTTRAHLAALGWPLGALRLAICKTPAGVGHAVLCVHTTVGVYVADNLFSHIAPWAALTHTWICRLDGEHWRTIIDTKGN